MRHCKQMRILLRREMQRVRAGESQSMDIEAFERRWIEEFAADVSREDIEKYVLSNDEFCNYIWHVFSWKLIEDGAYLVGDEAREAYLKTDKEGAIFIEPFEAMNSCPLPPVLKSSRVIDLVCTEIYVTAADFSWTYIKTHEGNWCGPYFYQKQYRTALTKKLDK